ncbi:MAG: diguanylate cyclase [bacterium]
MGLTIKTKIILSTLIIITVASGLILYILTGQQEMTNLMNKVMQEDVVAIHVAQRIKHNFILSDDYIFRYLATDDATLYEESERTRKKVIQDLKRIEKMVPSQVEKNLLRDINKEMGDYYNSINKMLKTFSSVDEKRMVLQIVASGDKKAPAKIPKLAQEHVAALLSAEGRARLTRIYSQCEKLVDINQARLEEAQTSMKDIFKTSRKSGLIAGISMVAVTILIGILLSVSILVPIYGLLKGVNKVTEGEMNVELPVKSSDEIGKLTQTFNSMIRKIHEAQQKLVTQTITDQLTGLYNFRYFQEYLNDEVSRAARYKHSFAILIIDIDHFKHYNDTQGHPLGNMILKEVSSILRDSLHREDFVARYGGEEFVVILPETDINGAKAAGERLRNAIEQSPFPGEKSQPSGKLTISIGGAIFPHDSEAGKALLEKADKALYQAKSKGRNRVCWA